MIDPELVYGIQPPPSYLQSMGGAMTLRGLMQQRQMNQQSMQENALKLQQLRQQVGDDAAMRAYFLGQYGQQAQDAPPQDQGGQMPPQASAPSQGLPLSQIGASPAQPQTAGQVMSGPVFSPVSQIGAAGLPPASQTVNQPAAQQPLPAMGGQAGKTAIPPGISYEDAAQKAFGRGDYRGGQALLQSALARREALTKIGLDTAHTGEYGAQGQYFATETAKMRAEALANGIGAVLQLAPEQQPAGHTAMLQQLVSQGIITPQQAQAEAQFPGTANLQQHYATLIGPKGLNLEAEAAAKAQAAQTDATQKSLVLHGQVNPDDAMAQSMALTPEQRAQALIAKAREAETGRHNLADEGFSRQRVGIAGAELNLNRQRFNATMGGGDDLTDNQKTLAEKLAKGEMSFQQLSRLPDKERLLSGAMRINPGLTSQTFDTKNSFTNPEKSQAKNLGTISRIVAHIGRFEKNSQQAEFAPAYALGMNSTGQQNRLNEDAHAVSAELEKLVSGGIGTEGQVKSWEKGLHSPTSGARQQAIDEISQLIGGQFEGMNQTYKAAVGEDLPIDKYVNPAGRAWLKVKGINVTGATPESAAAPLKNPFRK